MQDGDRQAFAEAFQMLAAAYRVEPTRAMLSAYWIALEEFDLARVRAAIVDAIKHGGEFMPSASQLRPKQVQEFAAPYHRPWIRPKEWGPSMLAERPNFLALAEAKKPEEPKS